MRILELRDGSHVPVDLDTRRPRRNTSKTMPTRTAKKRGRDDDDDTASTSSSTSTAAQKKRRGAKSTGVCYSCCS